MDQVYFKMRVGVLMAVQGRIELAAASIKHTVKTIKTATGLKEVPLFVAYSDEEDGSYLKAQGIEESSLVQVENDPLSAKNNAMLNLAMKAKGWTHLLLMGSDNFLTPSYISDLQEASKEGFDVIGTPSLAVVRPNSKKAVHHDYSLASGRIMGAGRLFSRKFLERCKGYPHTVKRTYYSFRRGEKVYLPKDVSQAVPVEPIAGRSKGFVLWPFAQNSGMDNSSMIIIKGLANEVHAIEYDQPQVLDVKMNQDNITPWAVVYNPKNEVDYQETLERFNISDLFE